MGTKKEMVKKIWKRKEMGVITDKLEELKDLLINKSISEQKEIIVYFFYKNRKKSKHFKKFYKTFKEMFENLSDDNPILKKFIEKTFINPELMISYPFFELDLDIPGRYSWDANYEIEMHTGQDWDVGDDVFIDFTDKKEKENDKIDWATYTSNLPSVLWSFCFYFLGIFNEIFYFKSSLMRYNRGTGVAIIPPQRALFNLLIPSYLWDYLENKKKGNER